MNAAHLHLLLNHLPVIGTLFSILLLLWALVRRSPELTRVALGFFVLAALSGVAAYFTGEPAEEMVEHMAGISDPILNEHKETAELATVLLGAYGLFSLGALVFFRRRREFPRTFTIIAFVLSLIPMAAMAYTAYLGGEVRHPEIRPGENLQELRTNPAAGTVEGGGEEGSGRHS